ncbi:MAG TPA: helix-turn-helix domain-containing protein [Bryobacteraceae bacterium]|nr:helix-turn-helix domain-containing protein [Bryobacteraceae bacterium]
MAAGVSSELRPPAGSTHERILRVGKTLFANRGYEHTSTSAIARQAGTSESQLMKHFGSKAGILEAIFTEGWNIITEQARVAIQGVTSPIEQLQIMSGCVLQFLERDPELKLLVLLEGRRIRREGHMVALTEGFLGFVRLADGVLNSMRDQNLLRPDLSPQAVRSALMGMLEGMLRDRFLAERLAFPADFKPAQIQQTLDLTLQAFLVRS